MKSSKTALYRGESRADWSEESRLAQADNRGARHAAFAEQLRRFVEEEGYTLADLHPLLHSRSDDAAGPLYAHPDDPELTWDGHGAVPEWVREWMSLHHLDPRREGDLVQAGRLLAA